ncbi:Na+/H+ antiporter NhaA [Sphingomonas sp. ac-8]|uniref:Na+/H+ antiporter NhaA n=1 Tax=Sphingomonas sp. ac-8 TaxID=3242977 RepID=UPI003A811F21
MAIRPRLAGKAHARAHQSIAARAFLDRVAPFFAGSEISGGPMLIATIVALVCTSTSLVPGWERFWDTQLRLEFGHARVHQSLAEWIDQALLPLFFIIIGTDVKRELVKGELSEWRTAAFPLFGSIGGMVVPVALFFAIGGGGAGAAGWGAVVTSDTAFGLALMAMFAGSLPAGVRALLLAFAAIDDLGGLLVIAFAYSHGFDPTGLAVAGGAFAAMLALRRLRWVSSLPYVLLAMLVWAGIFESGVHATIAGVVVGLVAPVAPRLDEERFAARVQDRVDRFQRAYRERQAVADDPQAEETAQHRVEKHLGYLDEMTSATDVTGERLVGLLNPWVSYLVLPLFVMSNVRIHLSGELIAESLGSTLALGVAAGLALGKPLGFLTFSALGTRLGLAALPERVTWGMIVAVGALAGIGFTLSLFVAGLAFGEGALREEASLAVLCASALAGTAGYFLLRWQARKQE